MSDQHLGYWIDEPAKGSLREVDLKAPTDNDVTLIARCTGISPGTERLVGCGLVPPSCEAHMACAGMQGTFALPLLYGYSFVGHVDSGLDCGRRAFVMRPHQQCAVASRKELHWLPNGMPDARATLFPNLETARNAVWDANLNGSERVVIIGGGIIGLLVAFVLSHEHGGAVVIAERDQARRNTIEKLPWVRSVAQPESIEPGAFHHAVHTSATSEGLQLAIDAIGFEGRITELSWYGDKPVSLELGSSFHYQRKSIQASQVSTIAASHRIKGYEARASAVMTLLADPVLDLLFVDPTPFSSLPETFSSIYQGQHAALCPVVGY